MHKKSLMLLLAFLIALQSSFGAKIFEVNETGSISLAPEVADPDNDLIQITYTPPLNENGEWQTAYGDAGEYDASITVSDGQSTATEEVRIIVNKKEEPPAIVSSTPEEELIEMEETESVKFSIEASDPNKDELKYQWFLDNNDAAEAQEFNYKTTFNDQGRHNVSVVVSDGKFEARKAWGVEVKNAEIEGILNSISDIIIDENEAASADIPDFGKYDFKYEISEPLGDDNYWKTDYNSAGVYAATLKVFSDDFYAERNITISVHNKDRPPVLDVPLIKNANEGEELRIELGAKDPDGDAVKFSAVNAPEGAKIEGNIFTWTPSFDAVKIDSFIGGVEDKLRILQKVFVIEFTAESNGIAAAKKVPVVVWDANRAPVLELKDIDVNEGDYANILPKYSDPDGNKVKVSYSGWINTEKYRTTFDDQGTYYVKVTASDGVLEASGYVKINVIDRNREPLFSAIPKSAVFENETLGIALSASDPDNDKLSISIKNPPKNSQIRDNIFTWAPPYDFTNETSEVVEIEFEASDGKSKKSQTAAIEVKNKNQPPAIISAGPKSLTVKAGQPVTFEVRAEDNDGDELDYTWNFGFFEKYKAGPKHKRIFSSKGNKEVRVVVSDGENEAEHMWKLNVV